LLGVLAGQGSEAQFRAAADFAQHLGLAFQIRDDMLDVIGNADELGKAVGVDTVKNTFVQLYGLDKCDVLVHEHTDIAKNALTVFADNEFMLGLADQLVGRTK
jgi:geranylgeranyl diphosphate synthase type II